MQPFRTGGWRVAIVYEAIHKGAAVLVLPADDKSVGWRLSPQHGRAAAPAARLRHHPGT